MFQLTALLAASALLVVSLVGRPVSCLPQNAATTRWAPPTSNQLQVSLTIEKGKDLMKGDFFTSDPYLQVFSGQDYLGETRPIFSNLSPVWGESFQYRGLEVGAALTLRIWDSDMAQDDDLGSAVLQLEDTGNDERKIELPVIYGPEGRRQEAGKVTVKVSTNRLPLPVPFVLQVGPVQYSQHKLANGVAYQLQLHNIRQYFKHQMAPRVKGLPGNDSDWFDAAKAALAATSRQAQNRAVYRHDTATLYGDVRTGGDLVDALLKGGVRDGKPVLYTYAITDRAMRFSEASEGAVGKSFAKHVVHTGAAGAAYYAGEMYVRRDADGARTLVLDNNARTYAAPSKSLPDLRSLMIANFPDLRCETLDFEDPKMVSARKEILAAW